MFLKWYSTVLTLTISTSAVSWLVAPWATSSQMRVAAP